MPGIRETGLEDEEEAMPAAKPKPKPRAKPKTKPKPASKAAAGTRRRSTAASRKSQRPGAVARTTELSDDVLKSVESGQRAAIDAVRKFVDSVDRALPPGGKEPSRRQDVVDAAMEMADKLVHTQYDFLRKVVKGAGESLGGSPGKK
jgi:hypothetical protein